MENPSASLASRYERAEKSQQRTYQYQTASKAEDYSSKYSGLSSTLQQSKAVYNPEYETNKYSAGYYQSLKGSLYNQQTIVPPNSSLGNTRFQVLASVTNQQETIDRSRARDSSYQTLSNDLDARIAKIKEKYYEGGEKLGGERWELSRTYGEKKVNNFVGENVDVGAGLARSRASRESLRQSIYSPYAATRPLAYQYA
jgi:chromosome segregation ATPase